MYWSINVFKQKKKYGNVNREEFNSMRLVLKWAIQKVLASPADVTVEQPYFSKTAKDAAIGKKGSARSKNMQKIIYKSKNKSWQNARHILLGWLLQKSQRPFLQIKFKVKHNIPQTCTFCHGELDTIIHLFWECQHAQTFYETTNRLVFDRYPILESNPDMKQFLFGIRNEMIFTQGNLYIILIKRFVWIAWCLKKLPTYINFLNLFQKELRVKKACYELDRKMSF